MLVAHLVFVETENLFLFGQFVCLLLHMLNMTFLASSVSSFQLWVGLEECCNTVAKLWHTDDT